MSSMKPHEGEMREMPAGAVGGVAPAGQGRQYWRSLDELADTAQFREFLEREFPSGASELFTSTRRGFLKLMGASLALAGLTSCMRWPEEKVVPYAHRPVNRAPGVPVSYATAFEMLGVAQGLVVTSFDGRPIKIEGNPTHPLNRGATDALAQASVLELYDPDRSRGVLLAEGGRRTAVHWGEFEAFATQAFAGDGAGVSVLCEATLSPSVQALREKIARKLPKLTWYEYEPVSHDAAREGARQVYGVPLRGVLQLEKAKVILALDADLFCTGDPVGIKNARDFAAGRRLQSDSAAGMEMSRLYVVEPLFTNTGSCADHRRAIPSRAIGLFVAELAAALGVEGAKAGEASGVDKAFLEALVADLKANAGAVVIAAGPGQLPAVHAAVAAINAMLGAVGKTLVYYADPEPERPAHGAAIARLAEQMRAGAVQTLLILGGNPVYNAPADLGFAAALAKVKTSIHLAMYDDETSHLCTWHLSRAHYLEAWGDARTFDGTVTIVQPLIEPLFEGRSIIEVLALVAGDELTAGYDIVRRTHGFRPAEGKAEGSWKPEFGWKQILFEGVVAGSGWQPEVPRLDSGRATAVLAELPASRAMGIGGAGAYELVFFPDTKVFDGRFANNGWLQEMPDPMTRLTWDNAALVNPKTATALKAGDYDVVRLEVQGTTLDVPVYIMPGVADGVIGLALGYGRPAGGSISAGAGVDAYALRTAARPGLSMVSVAPTGKTYPLATVQQHHMIDTVGKKAMQRRVPELVKESTFDEFKKNTSTGVRRIVTLSPWDEHKYDQGHKWGMAIDLTSCVGCSACVVACQAENNIPIVGKKQVLHGREMHWLRIDRYFASPEGTFPDSAPPHAVQAVHQPVLCMHCENAPCEEVCPVAATTHSREGLNMMTYNRCIGTRYCSNNCPYKVRRFNFFDYNRGGLRDQYTPNLLRPEAGELYRMQKNPDVTVRMRGVMEKCTYCVQRIETARITARREGDRPIRDGEIQTACQQSCPTQAIVFGDLNDKQSRASRLHALARTYGMLDPELNTKPRTQYLTRLRNPVATLDGEIYVKQGQTVAGPEARHPHEPERPGNAAPQGSEH